MTGGRFRVAVTYDSENPANRYGPDIWLHRSPRAAARRLAAIINGRAAWVPKRCRVGTRFIITDMAHEPNRNGTVNGSYSLAAFRELYL